VAAFGWLPTGPDGLPTGEVAAMAGAMDLTQGRAIRPGDPALDHNFCLARGRRELTPVLWLTGRSGVAMELATTEPGVQVYDARGGARPGGAPYEGLAIEAQGWPDAPGRPGFPGIGLSAALPCRQITEWRFARG
jgi:aldose 1-epimerase